MYPWDYLRHSGMSQLKASNTALSHVPDVPCIPGITWNILGYPSYEPATQACPMSKMSNVYLELPGMSQLRVSYTALSHFQDVPCLPGITRDILGCPN